MPNSNENSRGGKSSGFTSLVEAEKLLQIAFVLPSAVVICWVAGWWAAYHFHQKWMEMAGIGLGCISGLYFVIKTAVAAEKKTGPGTDSRNDSASGGTGNPS
jgi:ATP synthase protein I